MFLKFHRTDGKAILLPSHVIRFISDRADGGATIHTNIPGDEDGQPRTFRSRETVQELSAAS